MFITAWKYCVTYIYTRMHMYIYTFVCLGVCVHVFICILAKINVPTIENIILGGRETKLLTYLILQEWQTLVRYNFKNVQGRS